MCAPPAEAPARPARVSTTVGRITSLVLLTVAAALPRPTPARAESTDLAPYRRLIQGPDGARLLAIARASMERSDAAVRGAAGDSSAAVDSVGDLAWPGAPVPIYVSLLRGTATRACVGAPAPARASLAEAVRVVALEAMRSDRRRLPVRRDELDELRIVVSFTDEGRPIASPMLVDPGREGLLVTSPRGSVAFLPGEARTIRWALSEARRLGIVRSRLGDATYRRLEVVSLAEPERRLHSDRIPNEEEE